MKKLYLILILITITLISSTTAGMLIPAADKAKEKAKAPEKSPVITETPGGEWELERIDFIHYAKPTCNNNGVCEPELGENPSCVDCKGEEEPTPKEKCYKLLGVKWKSLPVGYVINPSGSGLTEGFVTSAVSVSAETWDSATVSELFNDEYTVDYTAQYGVQNFVNAIVFGDYPQDGVIGVTSIWFMRKGRQIVEFDILFDVDFAWGDATQGLVMDLQNIATHELGHGVGLDDIYSDACSEVTMYGYSDYGETKKRTLEQADITGLQKMYG